MPSCTGFSAEVISNADNDVQHLQERTAILQLHAGSLPLADDVNLPELATACHGYCGADLAALCREAAMTALSDAAAAILEGKVQHTVTSWKLVTHLESATPLVEVSR